MCFHACMYWWEHKSNLYNMHNAKMQLLCSKHCKHVRLFYFSHLHFPKKPVVIRLIMHYPMFGNAHVVRFERSVDTVQLIMKTRWGRCIIYDGVKKTYKLQCLIQKTGLFPENEPVLQYRVKCWITTGNLCNEELLLPQSIVLWSQLHSLTCHFPPSTEQCSNGLIH